MDTESDKGKEAEHLFFSSIISQASGRPYLYVEMKILKILKLKSNEYLP